MSNFMFGCDPEFFLKSRKTGDYVAAAGMFPGTKSDPFRLDQGAVQVDGLALEFNIDATDSPQEFQDRINRVLSQIYDMINDVDKDLVPDFTPFAEFPLKYFEDLPDEYKILGCDPDFNYTGSVNNGPTELTHRPFRTAAGHIHIGWTRDVLPHDPAHFEDCKFIAAHFGSCPDNDYSTANQTRKQYYGGLCAFRPKTYGVELRSPSNTWVTQKNRPLEFITYIAREMKALG